MFVEVYRLLRSLISCAVLLLAFSGCGAPELDQSHTGWRNPECWTCHKADSHNRVKPPFECVGCHGLNGAPPGHTNVVPCAQCHPKMHGETWFPDPESCRTCHVH
jgi:hypothetical protein